MLAKSSGFLRRSCVLVISVALAVTSALLLILYLHTGKPKGTDEPAVLAGRPMLGVEVRWVYTRTSRIKLRQEFRATLSYARALGANSVALAFNLYVRSPEANAITPDPRTPPAALVGQFIETARQDYRMRVVVRPLITEQNSHYGSRLKIHPRNPSLWFRSYDHAMLPYLLQAQEKGATAFAYFSELTSLQHDSQWGRLVLPFVQQHFRGPLLFDVTWGKKEAAPVTGVLYGIDAYPAIMAPSDASVATLLRGWNRWLTEVPLRAPADKTYILEVGIASQDGAYRHPAVHNWFSPIVPSIQARWFQAACDFFKQHDFRSLFFWSTSLTRGPQWSRSGETPGDFQGASIATIRRCFGSVA